MPRSDMRGSTNKGNISVKDKTVLENQEVNLVCNKCDLFFMINNMACKAKLNLQSTVLQTNSNRFKTNKTGWEQLVFCVT